MKKIEEMSFEEALKELENTVKKIDQGAESLESSIEAFERGTKLKFHCENKLKEQMVGSLLKKLVFRKSNRQ